MIYSDNRDISYNFFSGVLRETHTNSKVLGYMYDNALALEHFQSELVRGDMWWVVANLPQLTTEIAP